MLGAGVVGEGILRLLKNNESSIQKRLGAPIEVTRVVARTPGKSRPEVPDSILSFDPEDILNDPEIDVVVEVVGGLSPAGDYIRKALENKKQVVTANKALLAEHGNELAALAESQGVDLYFEAAVAGGIPIIRLLREALSSDQIESVVGIVNGTSNYVLTRMTEEGLTFEAAVKQAQAAGYAETDPTLDVDGSDAAHKLTLLATLAYGAKLTPNAVSKEGIESITPADIDFAGRLGYVIKPLAVAKPTPTQKLDLRVHPTLVPKASVLASIGDALNAVLVQGTMVGPCLISGLGAGAAPTAMSVVSDIVDVSRNLLSNARGRVPARAFLQENVNTIPVQDPAGLRSRYYLRFEVREQPGVLALVAGILGKHDVSIEQMFQSGGENDPSAQTQPVSIGLVTHDAQEGKLRAALQEIAPLDVVLSPPQALRIEEDDA